MLSSYKCTHLIQYFWMFLQMEEDVEQILSVRAAQLCSDEEGQYLQTDTGFIRLMFKQSKTTFLQGDPGLHFR